VHAHINETEERSITGFSHMKYQQEISRLKKKLQVDIIAFMCSHLVHTYNACAKIHSTHIEFCVQHMGVAVADERQTSGTQT
jgi:hypothetical protein